MGTTFRSQVAVYSSAVHRPEFYNMIRPSLFDLLNGWNFVEGKMTVILENNYTSTLSLPKIKSTTDLFYAAIG